MLALSARGTVPWVVAAAAIGRHTITSRAAEAHPAACRPPVQCKACWAFAAAAAIESRLLICHRRRRARLWRRPFRAAGADLRAFRPLLPFLPALPAAQRKQVRTTTQRGWYDVAVNTVGTGLTGAAHCQAHHLPSGCCILHCCLASTPFPAPACPPCLPHRPASPLCAPSSPAGVRSKGACLGG